MRIFTTMPSDEQVKAAFGRAVRELRVKASFSQESLAARAGLNRTYIGDVERGERNIAIVNMCKIAEALGTSLSEIIREMERHLG